MKKFPVDITHFIENGNWIFAKTYASTWPQRGQDRSLYRGYLKVFIGQSISYKRSEDFLSPLKIVSASSSGKSLDQRQLKLPV